MVVMRAVVDSGTGGKRKERWTKRARGRGEERCGAREGGEEGRRAGRRLLPPCREDFGEEMTGAITIDSGL